MAAGLPAVLGALWSVGHLRLRSRYVGAVSALYLIACLLLVALRCASHDMRAWTHPCRCGALSACLCSR